LSQVTASFIPVRPDWRGSGTWIDNHFLRIGVETETCMKSDVRKARIIVVEDNPADVKLLRLALENVNLDYELTVISDGGEAIAFFEKGKYSGWAAPDLAIFDLNLPKNGGLEVLAAMRRNPAFDDVAVTILSSSSWTRERGKITGLSARQFITKPSDLDQYMQIGHIVKEILSETAPVTN
jgi:chemotaxis family two-component system response regulator Rcp1